MGGSNPFNIPLVLYLKTLKPEIKLVTQSLLELNIFGVVSMSQIRECTPDIHEIITDSMEIMASGYNIDTSAAPMNRNWKLHNWNFDLKVFRKVVIDLLAMNTNGGRSNIHTNPDTNKIFHAYCQIVNLYRDIVEPSLDIEELLKPF